MRLIVWLLRAFLFFALFAFALNNQQDVTLHFFFGTAWRAPLVLVVLAVFTAGVAIGVLGMVPRWWKHRAAARRAGAARALHLARAGRAHGARRDGLPRAGAAHPRMAVARQRRWN